MKESLKKPPFFIVGHPRSGTTLLQILLDAHPNIVIPPESHIFVRFSEIFNHYGDLSQAYNRQLLVQDILNDEQIKLWNLDISASDFCRQLKDFSVKGIISCLFELYAQRDGKHQWGDKTPQHALYLQEIKATFPNAKFIHLIRDGRDVSESLKRVLIGPKSIYGIASRWRKYILSFQKFQSTLQPNEFIEVYYENLVQDTENELCRIVTFLGENPKEIIDYIPKTSRRQQYTQSATNVHNSLIGDISSQKIGVFKRKFRKREIEIFEAVAGDALRIHDYSLVTSGVAKLSAYERSASFVEDKCLRYLIKFVRPDMITLVKRQIKFEIQLRSRKILRSVRSLRSAN